MVEARSASRQIVGAFVGDDWVGAVGAAAAGIGMMSVLAVVSVPFLELGSVPGISGSNALAVAAMLVALSVGGSVSLAASIGVGFGGPTATLGGEAVLHGAPLLITAAGFTALTATHLRRLGAGRSDPQSVVAQSLRVWVLFCVMLLVICLLGRTSLETTFEGVEAQVSMTTEILGTLLGATGWMALFLTVAVIWRRPDILPGRIRRWRGVLGGPVAGTVVAVSLGSLLVLVVGLVAGVSESGGSASSVRPVAVAAPLLLAPNLLFGALGFASGTPATVSLQSGQSWSTSESVSLLGSVSTTPVLWLAPLALGLVLVVGGVVAALHEATLEQARRTGWLMGPVLGFAFGVIAVTTGVSLEGAYLEGTPLGGDLDFSVYLNYLVAPLLGAVWGALGGTVGALLAPGLPAPILAAVRRRVVHTQGHNDAGPVPAPGDRWA